MKPRNRIYISGRMSGLPREEILYRFNRCALWLRHTNPGARIVNPTKVWPFRFPRLYALMERTMGKECAYTLVLLYDLWLLSRCTRCHLIGTDWSLSRGAQTEMAFAQKADIEVTMDVTAKPPKKK